MKKKTQNTSQRRVSLSPEEKAKKREAQSKRIDEMSKEISSNYMSRFGNQHKAQ